MDKCLQAALQRRTGETDVGWNWLVVLEVLEVDEDPDDVSSEVSYLNVSYAEDDLPEV